MANAKYWIARYTSDLFRDEPRNVGVIVELSGNRQARFLGETDSGSIDGRIIKGINHGDVYRQWIDYWRSQMETGFDDLRISGGKAHYQLVLSGEVSDTGNDSAANVADHLYSMLVEGEDFEGEGSKPEQKLKKTVSDFFEGRSLLGKENAPDSLIHTQVEVKGKNTGHIPDFVQRNGVLCAIQTIDFMTARIMPQIDHAGLTAYMFRDIKDEYTGAELYSIVRVNKEDRGDKPVKYGLALLGNESTVIDCNDENAMENFGQGRIEAARN